MKKLALIGVSVIGGIAITSASFGQGKISVPAKTYNRTRLPATNRALDTRLGKTADRVKVNRDRGIGVGAQANTAVTGNRTVKTGLPTTEALRVGQALSLTEMQNTIYDNLANISAKTEASTLQEDAMFDWGEEITGWDECQSCQRRAGALIEAASNQANALSRTGEKAEGKLIWDMAAAEVKINIEEVKDACPVKSFM